MLNKAPEAWQPLPLKPCSNPYLGIIVSAAILGPLRPTRYLGIKVYDMFRASRLIEVKLYL